MKIETIVQGSYQTNSYVVSKDEQSKECLIIDTGLENKRLLRFFEDSELIPAALILTHGHLDHIHGIPEIREKFPEIKVCIHAGDAEMLIDPEKNLSAISAIYENFITEPANIILEDGQEIEFAEIKLKVLHTPGHTPGCICLYNEENSICFTGDSVFAGSVGRTDFPNYKQAERHIQLVKNVKEKVLILPDETKLYPGHGPATTVQCEKDHNPFFNSDPQFMAD